MTRLSGICNRMRHRQNKRPLPRQHAGRPMPEQEAVDRVSFEDIVGKPMWSHIEDEFK